MSALIETLALIGIDLDARPRKSSDGNLSVEAIVGNVLHQFEVEVKSVITAEHGKRLADRVRQRTPLLVVANRIAADAKRTLREAGLNYFDRRGELRIVSPPLFVDTFVDSAISLANKDRGPLGSQVAKEVSIACLLTPDQPHGIHEIARYINRVPSAVSNAMGDLRREGLVTSAGEAIVPDLFHSLLMVWRKQAVPLATLPDTNRREAKRLGLGLNDSEDSTGWALTDTRAAASWGIPIIAGGNYPPDFYVPSEAALRIAFSHLGKSTDPSLRACTAAVTPVRLACLRRFNHSDTTGERWPVANHIVVALDIAQDRARGLEALEQWQPEGITRAW